jgi:hypothetical protein
MFLVALGLGDAVRLVGYGLDAPSSPVAIPVVGVAAVTGLTAGVGLMRGRRWAAPLALLWAAASVTRFALLARSDVREHGLPSSPRGMTIGVVAFSVMTIFMIGIALHVWRNRRTLA